MLFVMDQPPHGSNTCQELLDMVLSAAAFDMSVSLLLQGDSVILADGEGPPQPEHRKLREQLETLPLFGVRSIGLNTAHCEARGITPGLGDAQPLSDQQIRELYRNHDRVVQL